MKLVLLILLLISCTPTQEEVSPVIDRFVRQFEKDFNVIVNYPVRYINEDNSTLGRCVYYQFGNLRIAREIEINLKFIDRPKYRIKELLYHELGHCALNLDHDNRVDKIGCPISIMNAYAIPDICIFRYGLDYYIDTLRR